MSVALHVPRPRGVVTAEAVAEYVAKIDGADLMEYEYWLRMGNDFRDRYVTAKLADKACLIEPWERLWIQRRELA